MGCHCLTLGIVPLTMLVWQISLDAIRSRQTAILHGVKRSGLPLQKPRRRLLGNAGSLRARGQDGGQPGGGSSQLLALPGGGVQPIITFARRASLFDTSVPSKPFQSLASKTFLNSGMRRAQRSKYVVSEGPQEMLCVASDFSSGSM